MMDEAVTGNTNQSQDGVARPEGHGLTVKVNNPKAVAKGINEVCETTYTRALAWALFVYREAPHMMVEELYGCLDQCGVRSPKDDPDDAKSTHISWLEYYEMDDNKDKCQRDISDLRRRLKNKGIPVNG
jgi:hypothetical protein